MSALQLQIADAITAEINAGSFSPPEGFTAARLYFARFPAEQLATIQVSVVPVTKANVVATRGEPGDDDEDEEPTEQRTFGVYVDFQRMTENVADTEEIDGYVNFADAVFEYFANGHRLTAEGLTGFWYQSAEYVDGGAFWAPSELYDGHVFEAAFLLTVVGVT